MTTLKDNRPRHQQIADWIRDAIKEGDFGVDDKLPSESELSGRFDVSRVTVRRALQTLENEERIYRSQGIGSFVKGGKTVQNALAMNDFMEDMKLNGLESESVVLRNEIEPAPPAAERHLRLDPGTRVFRLDRLRLADGEPIALDYTWLPAFYGQLIVDFDLAKRTIYDILENEYDIAITSGCYFLHAENADEHQARHLNLKPGNALFRMDRVSYTIKDKPVYYQQRYYRNDKFMYRMRVERNKEDNGTDQSSMPLREIKAKILKG